MVSWSWVPTWCKSSRWHFNLLCLVKEAQAVLRTCSVHRMLVWRTQYRNENNTAVLIACLWLWRGSCKVSDIIRGLNVAIDSQEISVSWSASFLHAARFIFEDVFVFSEVRATWSYSTELIFNSCIWQKMGSSGRILLMTGKSLRFQ
jgi:hypothetical protein